MCLANFPSTFLYQISKVPASYLSEEVAKLRVAKFTKFADCILDIVYLTNGTKF